MGFGAIFDLDGVLVDSNRYVWTSFNQILGSYGIHIDDEEINRYIGLSLRDHIKIWEEKYGLQIDFEKFDGDSAKIQLELIRQNERPNPDLIHLLEELKSHRAPMGVGTSSVKWRAEKILKLVEIYKYFPVIVAAEDEVRHKPYPDIFLTVAQRLGVQPEYCVVFEDASNGIEAAKSGSMKTIGFIRNDHFHKKEDLKNADLTISDFSEVSYNTIRNLFL